MSDGPDRNAMCAVFRWLFGTNEATGTEAEVKKAMSSVGQPLARSDDPFTDALHKIGKLSTSQARLDAIVPTRTLEQAMDQMFSGRH